MAFFSLPSPLLDSNDLGLMVFLVAWKPIRVCSVAIVLVPLQRSRISHEVLLVRQTPGQGAIEKIHFQIKNNLNYREQFKPLLFQPDEVCLMLGNCAEDGLSFGIQTGCSSQVVVSEQFSIEVPRRRYNGCLFKPRFTSSQTCSILFVWTLMHHSLPCSSASSAKSSSSNILAWASWMICCCSW